MIEKKVFFLHSGTRWFEQPPMFVGYYGRGK